MFRLKAALIAGAICCIPLTAMAAPTALSPQTIKSVFGTGAPFQSATPSGFGYTMVLKADGAAARTPKGSKAATTGTWHVNTTGYCSKWSKSAESCYLIKQDGSIYSVVDSAGKVAATWTLPVPAKPAAK